MDADGSAGSSVMARLRSAGTALAVAVAVPVFFLGLAVLVHVGERVPLSHLTRDPNAVSGAPPYLGFVSQLGILLWAGAVAVCIFSVWLLPPRRQGAGAGTRGFLFASGLLTLMLAFDDVFQLHEQVIPRFVMSEKAVFACYGVTTVAYFVRFLPVLLTTDCLLLGAALACFGASMGVDLFGLPFRTSFDPILLEDGAKFVGIALWLAYFSRTAAAAIGRSMNGREQPARS